MSRFASNPLDRHQAVLFSPTLDEMIGADHPVRLFDEILAQCQWADWESRYSSGAGQPAIHPRIMASIILYGLSRGIRSSRMLEYLCHNALDYIWLAQGHHPDHTTFCIFRNRFGQEIKDLFRQIAQVALDMKLASLVTVGLDGSRVQANSSRHATAGREMIETELQKIGQQFDAALAEMAHNDVADQHLFGKASTAKLPRELANLKARQEKLKRALAALKKKQEQAQKKADAHKIKVPVADPDAGILPNKEGGYAPNYTVIATTEGEGGFIMDAEVIVGNAEGSQTLESVDRIEENYAEKPQNLTADTSFSSGENLAGLEKRQITAYMPTSNRPDQSDNPAPREEPNQPVPPDQWDRLPRNARSKKLHHTAFVFDEQANCYYCPLGRQLPFIGHNTKPRRNGSEARYQTYRCRDCSDCALAEQCLTGGKLPRTVYRGEYEAQHAAMDERMASQSGQEMYRRRFWIAETPFAVIKARMKLRQFLTRSLEKVRTEWLWACTGFNLAKLVYKVARLRAKTACKAG